MARPAKLTDAQCDQARMLRSAQDIPVPRLARKFKVSESSMYKVLDGSYHARKGVHRRTAGSSPRVQPKDTNQLLPRTPNLFPDIDGNKAFGTTPGDDLVLEAARLIVARSRFAEMLRH